MERIRLHCLLDGRDVGETSALEYLEPLEARLSELRAAGHDVAIASGGGRQTTTMDRYDANWPFVENGWKVKLQNPTSRACACAAAMR